MAYLLNLAFTAGGAVLCRDPHGEMRFELACDHGHCGPSGEVDHGHDVSIEACWCEACPCEDMSLGISVVATVRSNDWHGTLASGPHDVLPQIVPDAPLAARGQLMHLRRPPPVVDQALRRLRTIVLIV